MLSALSYVYFDLQILYKRLGKGDLLMDIIAEIIAIEKQAEEIVANAEAESRRIILQANEKKEHERKKSEQEKDAEAEKYRNELAALSREHISQTESDSEKAKKRLDEIMLENGGRWADEIFNAVIGL